MSGEPSPPLIELRGICRYYGEGDTEVRALDDVSLVIQEGEFVAIMGPSGSGKSTAMNIIGCLDRPTSGHYYFNGIDVAGLSEEKLSLLRRDFLGFVFQNYNLLPRTTALENVELPLIYKGMPRAARAKRARSALARVGLVGREGHDPSQLSGGQQQRVAIARALVVDPLIILADEPTGNLDTRRSKEIMDVIAALNRDEGMTIIMVTHEDDMAAYARRLIAFVDGRVSRDEPLRGRA